MRTALQGPPSGPLSHLTFFPCALQPQLLRTSEDVAKMQEELEIMRPLLEEAAKDTLLTMEQIKVGGVPRQSLLSDLCRLLSFLAEIVLLYKSVY